MTKAEERALEICPPMIVKDEDGSLDDLTYMARTWVQKGYEAAQKDLGWISVKERLPEKFGRYYTCQDIGGEPHLVMTILFDDGKWCDWCDNAGYHHQIDYWMPIPELPKKK